MKTRSELKQEKEAIKKLPIWEQRMNDEQLEVIRHEKGPCRVLASAGSGKTRALVHRVARLVNIGVEPGRICAVTFSKKAADEMNTRIGKLDVSDTRVGTWHSLCLQILREDHTKWADWDIEKQGKSKFVLKDVLGYKGMDWKGSDLTKVTSFIGKCKAHLFAPDSPGALALANKLFGWNSKKAIEAFHLYNEKLEDKNILTFDDFLVFVAEHLANEDTRQSWASKWDHLIQDECLDGQTPVLLNETGSTMTIREMVDSEYDGTVLAYDAVLGKSVPKRVIGHHKIPLDKPMVRITVRRRGYCLNGSRMKPITEYVKFRTQYLLCTEDHRVWTPDGWKEAGRLVVGDEVVSETASKATPAYTHGAKISTAGKAKLARLMRRKNKAKTCGSHRAGNITGPVVRGGNGRGPTQHKQALLARLGAGWVWNHAIGLVPNTNGRGARCYKIDLANPEMMIAVEVDGSSHNSGERRKQDEVKMAKLRSVGWTVVRISNQEVGMMTKEILEERVYNSPAPAEVVAIDVWTPRDPFVYDIDVEDLHNFYADGVVVHNCQDANLAQIHIANLLARDHRNYMVVGDAFQSIFGFRGSSPEYLTNFEKDWPDARTIWMGRNYRSGKAIVDAANGIVRSAKIDGFEPKDMIAERKLEGKVIVSAAEDLDDEAHKLVAWIQEKVQADNVAYENFTALFRTNAQSRALEEALLGSKIPYVVVGGHSFYERKEVKDLLAYLRVAADRGDIDDIKRCINTPFRFLGARFVERIQDAADGTDIDWINVVTEVSNQDGIQSRQKSSACDWANLINYIMLKMKQADDKDATPEQKQEGRPAVLLEDVIRRTRYIDYVTKEEGEDSIETSGAANVREMIRVAERFTTTEELLDYIDDTIKRTSRQRDDKQAGGDRVLLMSVHRSKGLEWPFVWLAGFNEMILPHIKGDPEEERRLAYVAVTRARDELVLSHVRTMATRAGIKDAQPSRYLLDAGVMSLVPLAEDPPSLSTSGCQVEVNDVPDLPVLPEESSPTT